jgi:hypothetical protein
MQFMHRNGYTMIFNQSMTPEHMAETQVELVKHVVCSMLWENILEPLLVGATKDQMSWLEELCVNIKLLQPPNGKFII